MSGKSRMGPPPPLLDAAISTEFDTKRKYEFISKQTGFMRNIFILEATNVPREVANEYIPLIYCCSTALRFITYSFLPYSKNLLCMTLQASNEIFSSGARTKG